MYRLANRIPTSYKIKHLPRVTLTSVSKWNPHSNDDDDLPLVPPLLSSDTLTYHSQPGDSKSEGSSGLRGGIVIDITPMEEKELFIKLVKTEMEKECTVLTIRAKSNASTVPNVTDDAKELARQKGM
jgi:hypothetical protein